MEALSLLYVNKLFAPLEQFAILPFFGHLCYTPTNLTLIALVNFLMFAGVLVATNYPNQSTISGPSILTWLTGEIHGMLADLTNRNISLSKQVYFPIIYYVFWLILLSNLVGLIPYSYTVTSSFIFTFYVSLGLFLAITALGVYQHGYAMFTFGMPSGTPWLLVPLIGVVELFSYISRVFSLAIRLFANMMAGHTLLKILIGFSWVMLNSKSVLVYFALVPWIVVSLVMFFEFVISILQAYVFVTLISMYINDIIILD